MQFLIPTVIVLVLCISALLIFVIRSLITPTQIPTILGLIKNGRNAAAAKALKALISKDSRNSAAHYLLGILYLAEGKTEIALMEFKIVNQISQFGQDVPEIEFRKRIAELFLRFNQHEEALKEYLLLAQIEPLVAEHYYMAGRLFTERNRSESALSYLRRAIEIDPRHAKAHFELGLILYHDNKPVEAKTEMGLALRYEPDNPAAHFYIGKLLKENHDYSSALVSFEKSMRDPELKVKALVERGGCYMSLNEFDRAVPELERAVRSAKEETSNESLYARYFLAMCYEKEREVDKAIEQWERIYVKKSNFRDVAEKLAQYQEFRTDDKIKDYVTCGRDVFKEICTSIVSSAMQLMVREVSEVPNGLDIIVVENDSQKWLGAKKLPRVYRFLRTPEVLDDAPIRSILDQMKKLGVVRGAIVTSSGFTRTAMDFAENRPVEIIGKEQLQGLLNQADFFSSPRK
jgi:tetratricopeptide (TPR) repeat protein